MNTYELRTLARNIMDENGLTDWSFRVNNNTNRVGVCKYSTRTIEVSQMFLPNMSDEVVLNVLTHEVAHALVGQGYGHGPVWRRTHRSLGGDGERCQSVGLPKENYKYVILCSVTRDVLGRANRKGKVLARSVCTCHKQPPIWKEQR